MSLDDKGKYRSEDRLAGFGVINSLFANRSAASLLFVAFTFEVVVMAGFLCPCFFTTFLVVFYYNSQQDYSDKSVAVSSTTFR